MAVRIECAAIVLPRGRLDRRWPGGSEGLIEAFEDDWDLPFSYDEDLVSIGVWDIRGNDDFLASFAQYGVVEPFCRAWRHAAIVDEEWGPIYEVDWLDFVRVRRRSWAWMPPRIS